VFVRAELLKIHPRLRWEVTRFVSGAHAGRTQPAEAPADASQRKALATPGVARAIRLNLARAQRVLRRTVQS
jgi:hypothetical protein